MNNNDLSDEELQEYYEDPEELEHEMEYQIEKEKEVKQGASSLGLVIVCAVIGIIVGLFILYRQNIIHIG